MVRLFEERWDIFLKVEEKLLFFLSFIIKKWIVLGYEEWVVVW